MNKWLCIVAMCASCVGAQQSKPVPNCSPSHVCPGATVTAEDVMCGPMFHDCAAGETTDKFTVVSCACFSEIGLGSHQYLVLDDAAYCEMARHRWLAGVEEFAKAGGKCAPPPVSPTK